MMRQVLEYYGFNVPTQEGKLRCEFHDDEHPSATWSEKSYRCFGCGVRGTPVGLIMSQEGVSWSEALRIAEGLSGGVDKPVRATTAAGLALPQGTRDIGGHGTTLQARIRR